MAARILDFKLGGSVPTDSRAAFLAPRVGKIVSVDAERGVFVEFLGSAAPTRARFALVIELELLEQACVREQPVLLVFEDADPEKPIVTGLIAEPSATRSKFGSRADPRASTPVEDAMSVAPSGLVVDADADGRRVRLSAQDEIVFQCGKASVTLMRSGRVIVRGSYIETYATGTNRIKGGQVRIN